MEPHLTGRIVVYSYKALIALPCPALTCPQTASGKRSIMRHNAFILHYPAGQRRADYLTIAYFRSSKQRICFRRMIIGG